MASSATMRGKVHCSVNQRVLNKHLRRPGQAQRATRRVAPVRAQLVPDVDPTTLTYVGLGTAASLFLGTFFVVPQFKDQFKEEMSWRDIHRVLTRTGLNSVTPNEALEKSKRGAVLLDVRMAGRYENSATAPGSINIPLYQPIQNWDVASNLRRAGFAFFGVYGTELNENFMQQVLEEIPKSKEVVVICDNGGTIKTKVGAEAGFQSRSLKAVYFLQQAGYSKVYHLTGGLSQWFRDGLPAEEEEDAEAAAAFDLAQLVGAKGRK